MTNIQASPQTTMEAAKPMVYQVKQENEVAHAAMYGIMPGEWARTVATLSAVNRVLLAGSERLMSHQMELAQGIARDRMPGTQGDQVPRCSRLAVAYGIGLGSLVHSSNCEIAAILGQYLLETMHGLTARTEKALSTAP